MQLGHNGAGSVVLRILLVDDDESLTEVARVFLEKNQDFKVDTSLSGRDALEKIKNTDYDVIVSDYQMPEMNGIELLKKLKADGNAAPFILFTGRGREDVAIDALNSGASYYLQKGGDMKSQFAELSNMITRSARQAQVERDHVALLKDLQNSTRLLTSTIESSRDGIYAIDLTGKVLVANSRFAEIWGLSEQTVKQGRRESMLERIDLQLIDPEGFKKLIFETKVNLRMHIHSIVEFKDGRVFDHISDPMLAGEEVVGRIASFRDVTARVRAEETVRLEKDKAQQYLNLAGVMLIALDEQGIVTLVNKKGCEILGYDESDILGKSWFEKFLPLQMRGPVRGVFDRLMRGELGPLEHQPPSPVLCADGIERYIEFTNALLRDKSGRIVGTLSSGEDVTERIQAEDALKVSLAKYTTLFETLPLGVTVADKDGNITESNFEAEQLLGLSREDQMARHIDGREWKVVRMDGSPMPAGEFPSVRALKEGRMISDIEMGIVKGDDSTTWISVTAKPIPIPGYGVVIAYHDISEQRNAKLELSRSEERYRNLINGMLEGVAYCKMLYDEKGNPSDWIYLNVNDNFEKLTGLRNVVGKRVTDAIPGIEKTNRNLFEIYGRVASTGKPETFESEIKAINQWLRISVFCPEKDHFVAVFEDITVRKHSEEELQRSEAKFAIAFEASPEMMAISSLKDARMIDVNISFVRNSGYSREEVIGRTFAEVGLVNKQEEDRIIGAIQRTGSVEGLEVIAHTKEGDERTIVLSLATITLDGEPCALSVISDITERKRAEEALGEVEARFQSFMNHLPAVCYMLDSSDRYVYVNKQFEEATETTSDKVVGRTLSEVWPAAVAESFTETHKKVRSSERPLELIESVPVEGGRREYLSLKFPVPSIKGRPKMIGGFSVDITGQRQVEKALRRANKKLALLGSVTRHDTMNQLSVILAWIDIAIEVGKDLPTMEQLGPMREAARILRSQLEFTAEYQEMGIKEPMWIDLRTAVEAGIEAVDLGKISVRNDIHGVEVLADPMLEKVFLNLADNAARHGEKVTWIQVHCQESGGRLVVVFEDNGVGIPVDDKEKVFVRGFGKHTGLGLYLVREILEITSSSVKETGEPGKGARFEIAIPAGSYRMEGAKSKT